MKMNISREVADALAATRAVVALESTVIAHGLPHPQNIETALALESIVRDGGAVPATIAVFGGECYVGLTHEQIEQLATRKDIRKISRRDLSVAAAKRLDCATTVATTVFFAHRVGIQVFATGGIGGVHRGYGADISADLPELARTPITVVCSGAKIVLDLPATREWLETYGVTVLGWQCDEMPAFYSRSSGLPVDERVNIAAEAAAIVRARDKLGLTNSILITVPIPDASEISREELEAILADALVDADFRRISGKEITPFLMSEMSRRSDGRTLDANIELLKNNARVATEIAISLAEPS
ncbi:MAG TPA: pseudouridine-5'-phosphate glycosidase [Pyrinomonadaceae bacterium]|jgi:pseudouridine-5'-phosphate glycosidase|nr:pseudouridine-5'-phosphate glycosidase [Pyrinomonadaceae bacterium]